MFIVVFFLAIAVGNFALGFSLAVWLGHGPAWGAWTGGNEALRKLRSRK